MNLVLHAHPAKPPADPPFKVWANVEYPGSLSDDASINISFGIGAPPERFVIPEASDPLRTDGLWQTTCFEAFLRRDREEAYQEWNFAPSGNWAAYDFNAYRQGMAAAEVASQPHIRRGNNLTWWGLEVTIAVRADAVWRLGIAAILEEKDGTTSYWALVHPPGNPDFHHPDSFIFELPPAPAP